MEDLFEEYMLLDAPEVEENFIEDLAFTGYAMETSKYEMLDNAVKDFVRLVGQGIDINDPELQEVIYLENGFISNSITDEDVDYMERQIENYFS